MRAKDPQPSPPKGHHWAAAIRPDGREALPAAPSLPLPSTSAADPSPPRERLTLDRVTLTAAELATLLGVNPKTVYEAVARRQIPHRRLGRRVLFSRTAIEAWLSAAPTERDTIAEPTRVARELVTR